MTELISSTKSNLQRMAPNAKDIMIKVERDHEMYLSKIHVQVPGKVLHAEKKAGTIWEAIDDSYQAVLKQIEKVKSKRQTKRRFRKKEFYRVLEKVS
jgi:ribosomal subunit interface protein